MITSEHWSAFREFIEASHAQFVLADGRPQRRCSNCGMICTLSRGKRSGKWMWSHSYLSDCYFDVTGRRVLHDVKESAINGEMFK